ncbi:YdcF family protein [Lactobacillus sp. Sy-1]|uniref:YdcF family protein n=1 Tax=Lactobacillus sp. Sy-1 TaxID=2109645 RepID=UPI001C5B3236|nr:YdcF family protein [Lactobacillus sp. Sy-1]MBW1606388.1 YdcF family protein [Lactobacillus sp. Sy-1]
MQGKKKAASLLTLLLLSIPVAVANQSHVVAFASNQYQVQEYQDKYSYDSILTKLKSEKQKAAKLKTIDQAIEYNYWHKPNFASTQKVGVTSSYNNAALVSLYQEALKIAPNTPKYMMGLAAIDQMNGDYDKAQAQYKQILKIDKKNYQALVNIAVYQKFNNQTADYQKTIKKLTSINKSKTQQFSKIVGLIENAHDMDLNTDASKVNGQNNANHYIVILGFVLDSKGDIQPTLEQRLNAGLALAKAQPKAKIVVSGGELPQEPKVESEVMKDWLVKNGVAKDRIITETESKDTTQNARNTTKILKSNGAKSVTLVSSASHMRRAYTLFKASELVNGANYSLNQFVSVDTNDALKATANDYKTMNKIINDTLRVSGYSLLPGIQK